MTTAKAHASGSTTPAFIRSARASASYEHYRHLYTAFTERYRRRIFAADPRVGLEMAFHLSHNWGNAQAKAQLERFRNVSSWVCARGIQHYWRLVHEDEHRSWRPLWCRYCTHSEQDHQHCQPRSIRKAPLKGSQ